MPEEAVSGAAAWVCKGAFQPLGAKPSSEGNKGLPAAKRKTGGRDLKSLTETSQEAPSSFLLKPDFTHPPPPLATQGDGKRGPLVLCPLHGTYPGARLSKTTLSQVAPGFLRCKSSLQKLRHRFDEFPPLRWVFAQPLAFLPLKGQTVLRRKPPSAPKPASKALLGCRKSGVAVTQGPDSGRKNTHLCLFQHKPGAKF